MTLVCILGADSVEDEDAVGIYEDGDDWVRVVDGEEQRVSKKDMPYFPLSAVVKWDAFPVNNEILEALGKQWDLANAGKREGSGSLGKTGDGEASV